VGGWTVCRQVESRSACLLPAWHGLPRGRSVLDRFDRCGILMILIYALQCGQSSSSVQIDKLLWSGESQFF
jgi:hypothetical protein